MKINILLTLSLLCALSACGNKGEKVKFVKVEQASFSKYVNEKALPDQVNLSLDKNFVNNTYPIEIALYKDNKFYYDLPNLGDGVGTWTYADGRIELRAERDIFDMYIEIHSMDEKADNLVITFVDRFGRNTIRMTNNNLD